MITAEKLDLCWRTCKFNSICMHKLGSFDTLFVSFTERLRWCDWIQMVKNLTLCDNDIIWMLSLPHRLCPIWLHCCANVLEIISLYDTCKLLFSLETMGIVRLHSIYDFNSSVETFSSCISPIFIICFVHIINEVEHLLLDVIWLNCIVWTNEISFVWYS